MKVYTKPDKKIYYNNFIIEPINWYYKDGGLLFDITYNVYFKDGSYFTKYISYTLERIKKDLKKYI